ncbi:MAG: septum formation protein Maf [Ruminococcaceae bacterium]|nr:septum formation protein Maf [Oscillospiraceae bacterium]
MKKIILASKSPRRHEILNLAGLDHEIKVSDADERLPEGISAAEAARIIAERKALAVKAELENENSVIIAADTVVEVDGEIYGKPRDTADAKRMLSKLSGSVHFVHTGISIIDGDKSYSETVTTEVTMREIFEDEMDGYIDSFEPMDKAGAYGIQGMGGAFVSSLKGDYFNVMGLPLCRVCSILRECGIPLFENK